MAISFAHVQKYEWYVVRVRIATRVTLHALGWNLCPEVFHYRQIHVL